MSGTDDPAQVYWSQRNAREQVMVEQDFNGEFLPERPTAKELIRGIRHAKDGERLASRVEAVLALLKKYRTIPADLIERVLDGGKP